MFRIQPNPIFPLEVPIHLPGQDRSAMLPLVAKHLDKNALRAWIESAKGRTDAEFLSDVIVGWGPVVVDANDSPMPFTPEAFAELLLRHPSASHQIYDRYLEEHTKAPEKN